MTNTKKKSKNKMKLLSAVGMLTVSAAMLVSSTFAWFSMNKNVTATSMQVEARAEYGVLISNAADGSYDNTAATVKTTAAQLYPGSTSDLATWLHSTSTKTDTANTQQTYTAGTAWTANTDATTRGNYIVHDFYLTSSNPNGPVSFTSLDIKSITATVGANAPSQDLSKALRVGVMIAGDETSGDQNTYIYAPVTGHDSTNSIQPSTGAYTSTGRITVTPIAATTQTATTITTLPAKGTNSPVHVQVFIWFEGEDTNCISDNIAASLEDIDVVVEFEANGLTQN